MNTQTEMQVLTQQYKQQIWTNAKNQANPKAFIIKSKYLGNDFDFQTRTAYNVALSAAKKWATA